MMLPTASNQKQIMICCLVSSWRFIIFLNIFPSSDGSQPQDAMVHNAVHKMQNPIDKMFFLGFIAGLWVGFGGITGRVSSRFFG